MAETDREQTPELAAFEATSRAGTEAFNRHDFEGAFASLPPDVEWQPLESIPGAHLLKGKDAVTEWFRQMILDLPDFRVELLSFSQGGRPGVFIVEFRNHGTGRASGLQVAGQLVHQVWELDRDPWRISECGDREQALAMTKATG